MSVLGNSLLLAADAAPTAYQVSRSLRFNGSIDSAHLSRTPASAGTSRTTWTLSFWVKRSTFSTAQWLFFSSDLTANTTAAYFTASDTLEFYEFQSGSYVARLITTQVFRDPSAWYHFVFTWDTNNGTSGDRLRIYVNNQRIDAFSTSTYPGSGTQSRWNNNVLHYLSRGVGSEYFAGYLANVEFVDGSALTPSSFGETDSSTGQWIPKLFSGSYGSQGWKLTFADNSNNTASTLGADTSGNGNNWTPNNLSVTAGAGNDALTDSPTSYGSGTSGGDVRGNFCTLNPLSNTSGRATLSDGNLQTAGSGGDWESVFSTFALSSGKWYMEATMSAAGDGQAMIGVCKDSDVSSVVGFLCGSTANSYGYYSSTGKTFNNTSGPGATYGASYGLNDVIGVALNMDAGTLAFYKNGVSQGQAYSGLSGAYFFCLSTVTNTWVVNFGQRAFAYTPPANHKPLVDTYLPTPTVAKPSEVFQTVLWDGDGASTRTITVGFEPDLIWEKVRNNAYSHLWYDAVRGFGAYKAIGSNSTIAEGSFGDDSVYGYVSGTTSTGFSLVKGSTGAGYMNSSGYTQVAWCWDAGTSTVTNTAGSISSQVRANASAGFSIVTYTGNGSNSTVGHGLGVAPQLVILKGRGTSYDWIVWHQAFAATSYIALNATSAVNTGLPTVWNSTTPTSTVFSIGTAVGVNTSGSGYVAYCFAPVSGYSSFGVWQHNNSNDGPFIYTGFRPKLILLKNSDNAEQWFMFDSARRTYNLAAGTDTSNLRPNSSGAEGSYSNQATIDFLSNGFKIRTTTPDEIAFGTRSYIYGAWAESPFQYARAR